MSSNDRRKISNIVVDRGALVRLSIPFIWMAVISIGIVAAVRWQVLTALQKTELVGVENLPVMNALLELQESVTLIGMIGLASLAVFCLVMWVLFSHRMFGPPVAMRRHVQNLIGGDYSSRVNLRATDEFKDLAHDLNQLVEHLQSKVAKRG